PTGRSRRLRDLCPVWPGPSELNGEHLPRPAERGLDGMPGRYFAMVYPAHLRLLRSRWSVQRRSNRTAGLSHLGVDAGLQPSIPDGNGVQSESTMPNHNG